MREKGEIINDVLTKLNNNSLIFSSPPEALAPLSLLLEKPEVTISEVEKVVSMNPVLSGRLIQISNSVAFSRGYKILNLTQAIHRLGFNFVKSFALSMSLIQARFRLKKEVALKLTELWKHSLHIGALNVMLLRFLGKPEDPSFSLLLGVMHGLGELPLYDYVSKIEEDAHVLSLLTEADRFAITEHVFRLWLLPDEFKQAIKVESFHGDLLSHNHYMLASEEDRATFDLPLNLNIDSEAYSIYLADNSAEFKDLLISLGTSL